MLMQNTYQQADGPAGTMVSAVMVSGIVSYALIGLGHRAEARTVACRARSLLPKRRGD